MPSNTRTPRPGGQLGAYKLRALLGSGGFGEVYLGEHIHLHSLAAIKVLHDDLVNERAEQIRLEAQWVAQLAPHPHIVRVLDYNIENGQPFIVMDYAINGDLRKRHGIGKKVPLADIVSYVKQLACGLQHAHDNGVVHCDVKPENMFIGSQSRIMIGDFGIAVVQQGNISQSKNTFGTTAYMSPEQITGQPEPASDQYALAIVVYEWLTGRLPFNGENKMAIAYNHLHARPPSMRFRHPSIPAAVEKVVMKALRKEPLQRYASITAFAEALEEAAETPQVVARQNLKKETSFPATWYGQRLKEYEQALRVESAIKQETLLEEESPLPVLTKCLTKPYAEKALAQLLWIERSCLVLHIDAQFTSNEVAQILDIEEPDVQKYLENGQQQFLQIYDTLLEKEQGILLSQVPTTDKETISRVERLIQSIMSDSSTDFSLVVPEHLSILKAYSVLASWLTGLFGPPAK